MKIVLISDTHGAHRKLSIPDGDILIHAGDSLGFGVGSELIQLNDWFGTLPHKHKILIAGNHDWVFEKYPDEAKKVLTNVTYLQDSFVVLDGLKIYGSPWQPEFCNWAFNLPRGKPLADKWKLVPDDTDILVTHGPPYGFGDQVHPTRIPKRLGCEDLATRVEKVKPLLHVFGHIHGGFGITESGTTVYVNAAIMDEAYQPVNPATVISVRRNTDLCQYSPENGQGV